MVSKQLASAKEFAAATTRTLYRRSVERVCEKKWYGAKVKGWLEEKHNSIVIVM